MIGVFISYAREDGEVARRIYDLLQRSGFRPWLDQQNLIAGQDWEKALEKAVRESDVQVFLCSSRSVNKRGFFQREIRIALAQAQNLLEGDIAIVPYLVEHCEVPDALAKYQWVDGRADDADRNLIRALAEAAAQRGVLDRDSDGPIVVDYAIAEKSEKGGTFRYSYVVPSVRFSGEEDLTRAINGLLFGNTHDAIMRFRREVIEDKRDNLREIPNEYHTKVYLEFLSQKLLSAVSSTYWYGGGVHGNSSREAINLSVEDRSLFSASMLFSRTQHLEEHVLREIDGTEMPPLPERGDIPELVRYCLESKSYLTRDGLHLLFDPYEIFCYAAGNFDVLVPLDHPALNETELSDFGKRIVSGLGR